MFVCVCVCVCVFECVCVFDFVSVYLGECLCASVYAFVVVNYCV